MPKELINHARTHEPPRRSTDSPTSNDAYVYEDPELAVSWSNLEASEHVQVFLDTPVTYLRSLADHVGDEARQRSKVWSVGLSRHEVNHLIRTLRRARNQVFGVDE